jgi:osmotically-inducible protein OsmY
MTNETLEQYVNDELAWDPKVDVRLVAVSVEDGQATLRGTVGSLRQKLKATKAAERVRGITKVRNQLDVRLMNERRRADADLRGDVLQALMLDSVVPASIDARVKNGRVTLTGTARWQFERNEAEHVVANVRGVDKIVDYVELTFPEGYTGDIEHAIRKAFKRAKRDADRLSVTRTDGTITLAGIVPMVWEHDAAVTAAWSAPGVFAVEDQIEVLQSPSET